MTKEKKREFLLEMQKVVKKESVSGLCVALEVVALNFEYLKYPSLKGLGIRKPKKTHNKNFYFKPFLKAPRIRLINEALEKLK